MKTIILLWLLIASGSLGAQQMPVRTDSAPLPVQQAFIQEFPGNTHPAWFKTGDGGYRASYNTSDGLQHYINYDDHAHKTSWGVQIMTGELPPPAVQYLTANYPGEMIDKTFKLTEEDHTVYYELYLSNGKWLMFNSSGTMVPIK